MSDFREVVPNFGEEVPRILFDGALDGRNLDFEVQVEVEVACLGGRPSG